MVWHKSVEEGFKKSVSYRGRPVEFGDEGNDDSVLLFKVAPVDERGV